MVDWLFRDRDTGRIAVAQAPNIALTLWIIATVIRLILRPSGAAGTALELVATGALIWWAGDEILRGVNPWRRLLGGAVLVVVVRRLVG